MKKHLLPFLCTLVTTSVLFANTMDQNMSDNSSLTYQRGQNVSEAPPSGPRVADGVNINLSLDFLWWKASQQGLAYATSGVLSNVGNAVVKRGTQETPDFEWGPGFKVAFGVALPWDHWDLNLEYTWLYTFDATNHIKDSNGNIAEAVAVGSLTSSTSELSGITKAHSKWDLQFNVIDIDIGKNYYLSNHVTLRPFAGLKWTWQDQDWTAHYTADNLSVNGSLSGPGKARMKQDHFFWGVGVRTGLKSQWYVTTDWSIFANTALSALWNDYTVDRRDKFQPNGTDAATVLSTSKDCYDLHSVAEFQLGMMGEWWFYNNNLHFAISAAYEQQVWINYGEFIYLTDHSAGDLSLHGLTLKARFDF